MTIVKNSKVADGAIFDCITQEADRQRIRHPQYADAIDAAEKKTRALVRDGKLEQSLMLVEFTKTLGRLWSPKVPPGTRHNAIRYASE
jgi:hypothetical protein